MKHRSVVASYIFAPGARLDDDDDEEEGPMRVALFRRSHHDNLRSYRGLLAPISGSIDAGQDASPTAAAVRELREETGLAAGTDLRLQAVGPPFSFADEEAGRSWTVYPFGWTLICGEERIALDWEHDGWEWVEVREVLAGDAKGGFGLRESCVPRVEESLRRVYFGDDGVFGGEGQMSRGMPAGRSFYAGMRALRDDKENGARVLATRAVQYLREILQLLGEAPDRAETNMDRCWRFMKIAGWHLVHSARPSMNAAIGSAVVEALSSIQPMAQDRVINRGTITARIDSLLSSRSSASTRLAEQFAQYVARQGAEARAMSIVTLSSSSTIKAALLHLIFWGNFESIDLSILESRPRCEGAGLAASLISALKNNNGPSTSSDSPLPHVSITIAPDSHLASLLSKQTYSSEGGRSMPYLLLGADRISPHGAVLNKTLSLSAAALAKALEPNDSSAKVVMLAETDKLATITDLDLFRQDETRSREREMRAHEPEHGGSDEVMRAWLAAGVVEGDRRVIQAALAGESTAQSSVLTVSIRNETFEWVPPRLVDVYITEKGEMGRHQIGEQCIRKTHLATDIFTAL